MVVETEVQDKASAELMVGRACFLGHRWQSRCCLHVVEGSRVSYRPLVRRIPVPPMSASAPSPEAIRGWLVSCHSESWWVKEWSLQSERLDLYLLEPSLAMLLWQFGPLFSLL